jgi:hypothetical protein
MSGLVASFFDVLIYCVIVVLVAVTIVWVLGIAGYPPSPDMLKYGKLLVLLLCLAVIVLWLVALLGVAPYMGPHFLRS